jgi:hypothetical protein
MSPEMAVVCTGTGPRASVIQTRNLPAPGRENVMSDQPPASGPRKWNRPALIVAGTLTAAVAVSVGLVAAGGHPSDASLSGKVTDSTQTPATSSPLASPLASSSSSSLASSLAPSDPPSSSARSSSSPSPSAASSSARSSGSAPWSSASCPSQLASWRGTGAGGQLQVVVTDLTIASQAAISLRADPASGTIPQSAATALSTASASLRSSTQAAGKNLIPGCVSGAYQAEIAGLTDLGRAVAGFDNAVSETASGDYGTAQQSSQNAVATLQSGSAKMATAMVDVNQYGTS